MPREYIPVELDRRVRTAAKQRCGYCLSPQRLVMARLEIEHIIPVSPDGTRRWTSIDRCPRFNLREQLDECNN